MLATLTKQDVQAAIDNARDRITERMVTKYDIQTLCDQTRQRLLTNMQLLHQQNQRLMSQSVTQMAQTTQRLISIEMRLNMLEQELRQMTTLLQKALQQITSARPIIIAPSHAESVPAPNSQYVPASSVSST
jgi:chromosome segregation ATPase